MKNNPKSKQTNLWKQEKPPWDESKLSSTGRRGRPQNCTHEEATQWTKPLCFELQNGKARELEEIP